MSDPIYERYKARQAAEQEAASAAAEEKRAANERERLRLLDTVSEEVERALERLESIDFGDEAVSCMFRKVQPEDGDVQEAATWPVGNSRPWRWTYEDEARDLFVLSSDRKFWRSKDVPYANSSTVFIPLDLSGLNLTELQDVMRGLGRVGKRKADLPKR